MGRPLLEKLRLRFWLGAMDAIERVETTTSRALAKVWLFAVRRARAGAGLDVLARIAEEVDGKIKRSYLWAIGKASDATDWGSVEPGGDVPDGGEVPRG